MDIAKIQQIILGTMTLATVVLTTPTQALIGGQVAHLIDPNMRMEAGIGCETGECGSMQSAMLNQSVGQVQSLLQEVGVHDQSGRDPRIYIARRGAFAPVGRIESYLRPGEAGKGMQVSGFSIGTATLVSPCLILTARHISFLNDATNKLPRRTVFSVGEDRNGFKHNRIEADFVRAGRGGANRPNEDIALFRLRNCVGNDPEIGWMNISLDMPDEGRELMIAGMAADRDWQRLTASRNCRISGDFALMDPKVEVPADTIIAVQLAKGRQLHRFFK